MGFGAARAAALLLIAAPGAGARAQAPSGVLVTIAVDGSGSAQVSETFPAGTDSVARGFQLLTQPCAEPSALRFTADGNAVSSTATPRGPWLDLAPESAGRLAGNVRLVVSYEVRLGARVAGIPLVVPAAPLGPAGNTEASARSVTLTLDLPAAPGAHPLLPHFASAGPGHWRAQLIALPSVVRADLGRGEGPLPAACAEPRASGSAGTFGIRFGIFLATLVLWVPLYFWWALRQDRGS